ncbi:YlaF family protein [Caldibacillus lycopersici]|uniref:YlaF family protein n=1 Tax=Perspicuibacillus lycopersici TaxID=1325689 RepID=A0AAE3IRU0_9BACI|nr:YlaF family protein [Perspicuibacillus lycopersici]MCU9612246.1 YlaF family protein [Perspicuibacillus lycopersici]
MKNIKWNFFFYSIIAVFSMVGIGIAIGLQNIVLGIVFTLIVIIVMGRGFQTKKKMRELGKL